jgi:parallel beta-helix repeat protein
MKTSLRFGALMCALVSSFILLPSALPQGSLTPPGAPAPTMKTLDQVEPRIAINATNTPGDADSLFKITQPGSYYLTGNITGESSKHGVEIVASGVTLDLNGFDLLGAAGSLDGLSVTVASLTNIAVVNGSVRNWGDAGVDLGTLAAANCRVADMLVSGNSGHGIFTGNSSTVTHCSASSNGFVGIAAGTGSTVSNCSATSNSGNGIVVSGGGSVTSCSASSNLFGITGSNGSTIANCTVYFNTAGGITSANGGTVTNCSAYFNTGNGVSTNFADTIINCTVYQNTGNGISVQFGSTIANCTARNNTLDGIVCTTSCVIRGNTCATAGNGADAAGIHATGSDNRIEGNNCTDSDRGIDVDGAGNIIIKNTCSGNTIDWTIAANNVFGPIIDRRAPASAAVSGFTAASTLGSTEPNANFSF